MENSIISLEKFIEEGVDLGLVDSNDLFVSYSQNSSDRYKNTFPKQCANCGNDFYNLDQYNKMTAPLDRKKSVTEFTFADGKSYLLECRSCTCDNTLALITPTRRVLSPFRNGCRSYFDICVKKLIDDYKFTADDANVLSRVVLREVLRTSYNKLFRPIFI